MLISKNKNGISEIEISNFEKKYDFVLPPEYRRFLLKYNGGKTYKTSFKTITDIQFLYGLGTNNDYNLESIMDYEIVYKILSMHLLPIGKNSYGDYICIELKNINGIYLIYHDNLKRRTLLANSFMEFVKHCDSERIEHVPTIEERWERVKKAGNEDKITPNILRAWEKEIERLSNLHQEEVII